MRLGRFSGTRAHRDSLYRTLVSQLVQHEQIRTTLAKAKKTARMTERVITWAKRNTIGTQRKAEGYIRPWLRLRGHLFSHLARRYAGREGGYTRVHKLGYQRNNRAPVGLVELVDNPRDMKRTMCARSVARLLALQELGLDPDADKRPAPAEVWRPSEALAGSDEAARAVIESLADRLSPRARLELSKVLSPAYVSSWDFCRPMGPIPSLEKMRLANQQRKERQATEEWQRGRPNGGAGPDPILFREKDGAPTGPYAAFLAMVGKQFLAQIGLLSASRDPRSLVSSQLSDDDRAWLPSAREEEGPRRRSVLARAMAATARDHDPVYAAKLEARRARRERPAHLRALNLPSLKPRTVVDGGPASS